MVWVLLIGAIASEVMATTALKLSDGFSKVVPSVIVAVGYILAFVWNWARPTDRAIRDRGSIFGAAVSGRSPSGSSV